MPETGRQQLSGFVLPHPLLAPCHAPAVGAELLADAFLPDDAPDLFNRAAFHRLHRHRFTGAAAYLQWRPPGTERIRGTFHALETAPGLFTSPGRGSYGGFDVDDGLTCAEIGRFVALAEDHLRERGARRLDVVLPPFCYAPERAALVFSTLAGLGYVVERHELNQSVALQHAELASKGTYANRKRLNKAVREGVAAGLLKPAEYRAAYDVLAESRRKKNYTLSMSWADVAEMVAAFPTDLRLFGAWHGGAMVAAAICVVVNPRLLYVYAWGEVPGIERLSPVTAIADAIYRHARAQGFRRLDLGTSSVQGVVNPGLFAFKKSLGAAPSIKLFLSKTLTWRS
jgi:hypothetical protein